MTPAQNTTKTDRDAALSCCNEALRNFHPKAASDVDFEAMALHFARYRTATLEEAAAYLDGYAGGHHMAQSCASVLRAMAAANVEGQ